MTLIITIHTIHTVGNKKMTEEQINIEQQIEVVNNLIAEKEQAIKDAQTLIAELENEVESLNDEKWTLHKRSLLWS
jgi:hypothetical protein